MEVCNAKRAERQVQRHEDEAGLQVHAWGGVLVSEEVLVLRQPQRGGEDVVERGGEAAEQTEAIAVAKEEIEGNEDREDRPQSHTK